MSQSSTSLSASVTGLSDDFQASIVSTDPCLKLDKQPNQARSKSNLKCLDEKLSKLDLANSGGEEGTCDSSEEDEAAPYQFDPAQCLFCNERSAGLTENMSHMQKRHGMLVPNPDDLIVDIETLVGYLHLVIFEYAECLYCGSVRNTPQAAQQHMTGKGHCRFDITKENSEFRDFYNFDPISNKDNEETTGNSIVDASIDVDEKTRRLASGRVVSHRNARKPRVHQPVSRIAEINASDALLEELNPGMSSALASGSRNKKEFAVAEKRDMLFNKQLATLRSADRQALMHLPLSQQRTLVATAKRQQEKWNRTQLAQEIKRQLKANP